MLLSRPASVSSREINCRDDMMTVWGRSVGRRRFRPSQTTPLYFPFSHQCRPTLRPSRALRPSSCVSSHVPSRAVSCLKSPFPFLFRLPSSVPSQVPHPVSCRLSSSFSRSLSCLTSPSRLFTTRLLSAIPSRHVPSRPPSVVSQLSRRRWMLDRSDSLSLSSLSLTSEPSPPPPQSRPADLPLLPLHRAGQLVPGGPRSALPDRDPPATIPAARLPAAVSAVAAAVPAAADG